MHFIDRSNETNPPIDLLETFNSRYKADWAKYNFARANNIKPCPSRPPSSWLDNKIRNPLKSLFLKNCGYCGIHTDTGSDAEVDHHLPTSLDINADHVFDWDNYIWSCHSCNNMKNNNYPFLNPCSESEMEHIYFHSYDGRYLYYKDSPLDIIDKFEITVKYSNLNLKNRPERRKYIFHDVMDNHLDNLKTAYELYQLELSIQGEDSDDVQSKLDIFNAHKKDFINLIKCEDYLFLIKFAFESFSQEKQFIFPFTFDELLIESGIKSA